MRYGEVWCGEAGRAGLGEVRFGWVRYGMAGAVRFGKVWSGEVGYGGIG